MVNQSWSCVLARACLLSQSPAPNCGGQRSRDDEADTSGAHDGGRSTQIAAVERRFEVGPRQPPAIAPAPCAPRRDGERAGAVRIFFMATSFPGVVIITRAP